MPNLEIQVKFYANVGHSPAWSMIPHALVDLESKALDFQPFVAPYWSDPCMVATDADGMALGFLVYRSDEVKSSWFILLAWVSEAHRRKGIHTTLFEALVARARKRDDILAIECGTHINNRAAQAAFEAQGRSKTAIMYSYPLKKWADGKQPTDTGAAT